MVTAVVQFTKFEDLEAWLKKQPHQFTAVLAMRAALRLLPRLPPAATSNEVPERVLLPLFRSVQVSSAISKYPERKEQLAVRAAAAAHVAVDAAVVASVLPPGGGGSAARAIAAAADAARARVANIAVPAARPALSPDDVWESLSEDAVALVSAKTPIDLAFDPLWLSERPASVVEAWRGLKSSLRKLGNDWHVWTDWYDARLRGGPTWPDLTPERNEELEVAIAALSDEVWQSGPAAVNAEIRRLTEQAHQPVSNGDAPETSQTVVGAVPHAVESSGGSKTTPPTGTADTDATALTKLPRSPRKRTRHNLWLCQYVPGQRSDDWKSGLASGSNLSWFSRNQLYAGAITGGDPVIYWRAIHPKRKSNRGGLIGTGRIASTELELDTILNGFWFQTTVEEFFEQDLIPREKVIGETGFPLGKFRGELTPIPDDAAESINELLLEEGHRALFTPGEDPAVIASYEDAEGHPSEPPRQRHETEYVSDRPETARDLLRRAPLSFALAAQINRIWDAQVSGDPARNRWRRIAEGLLLARSPGPSSQADEAAFILHIDAPWGGGKTTFANFIARILNPAAFGLNVASADGRSLLKSLPLNDDKLWKPDYRKRRWHVVHFNAWQNEHVSPPWWNFYESIRRQCMRGLVPSKDPNASSWKLLRWMAPAWAWLVWIGRRVGFSVREWLWKVLTPAMGRTLLALGAVIVAVYSIWHFGWLDALARATSDEENPEWGPILRGVLGVTATSGVGFAIFSAFRSGLRTMIDSAGGSADATSLGQADPLFRFQRHFSWFVRQLNEPVLVIVDDLDRCKPEFVVELVRGLLTIFRSSRVVFLLLGDKAWIEEAFAQVHENMAKAHTDAQITFGGRFAEKAIQLSFILPEATDEQRNAYLVAILTGKLPVAGTGDGTVGAEQSEAETKTEKKRAADLAVELETFEKEVRQDFSTAHGTEDLVRMKTAHRSRIGEIFQGTGDGTDNDLAKRFQQAAANTVDVEAVFRSATSEQTEQDIRHGIEPVAPFLPGNPRRIKRIVNMVSAFQESGQISEKIDPLSLKWRQLVLWTVIMSEYPQAWRTLVLEENVAREVVELMGKANDAGNITMTALKKGASDEEKARRPKVASVVERPSLIRLLRGDPFNNAEPDGENHAIDEAALMWLRRLTPLS